MLGASASLTWPTDLPSPTLPGGAGGKEQQQWDCSYPAL